MSIPPTSGQSLGAARPSSYTTKTAGSWRLRFQGALATNKYPKTLNQELVQGIRGRAWTRLRDESNRTFKSFPKFCETPEPFGLGTPYELVNEFLIGLIGKRAVGRLTTPEPNQGARTDQHPDVEGEKLSRHESRKNAINCAPDIVRKLHDAGHLTMKEAERFGVWARKTEKRKLKNQVATPDEEKTTTAVLAFCEKYSDLAQGTVDADTHTLDQVKAETAKIFPPPVYSVIETGDNSEGLERILNLHVARGSTVADLTFGKGVFWRRIDKADFDLKVSDLTYTGTDSRWTEYQDKEMDAVVFDPPFMHSPGCKRASKSAKPRSWHARDRV